ncbi:MAG: hypothetical protein EP312_04930 [Gammaproteobacteria bacterium]|nr:MAG: hypothetical protein EP312_04930 [Gammaproteobacteria bacterium]
MNTWFPALVLTMASLSAMADGMNEHAMDPWYDRTDLEIQRRVDHNDWQLDYRYLGGPDFHKLLVELDLESEDGQLHESTTDVFYARPVGTWGLAKIGASYRQRPSHAWRTAIGYEHLLPGFIEAEVTVYGYAGGIESDITLERPTALSNRITAYPGIEARYASDEDKEQEVARGWNSVEPFFRLEWKWDSQWHSYAEYRFKKYLGDLRDDKQASREDPDEHQWHIGVRMMF